MKSSSDNTSITPESALMAVTEMFAKSDAIFAQRSADFDRQLKKSRTEFDQRSADFDRQLKKSRTEFDQRSADFDRQLKESSERFDREMKESSERFDREMKESRAEFDQRMKESSEKFDRKMESISEQMGGWGKTQGLFAEEYFFNSFEKGQQNFFGEKFDKILARAKGHIKEDEYDILLVNGHTAGVIEVKFKARKDDIPKILKKVDTFRANFPEYKNHRLYLAMATLVIHSALERECIKQGIAVIKQAGDKVIIYDEHLKAF
jgi:hypothetical protein